MSYIPPSDNSHLRPRAPTLHGMLPKGKTNTDILENPILSRRFQEASGEVYYFHYDEVDWEKYSLSLPKVLTMVKHERARNRLLGNTYHEIVKFLGGCNMKL